MPQHPEHQDEFPRIIILRSHVMALPVDEDYCARLLQSINTYRAQILERPHYKPEEGWDDLEALQQEAGQQPQQFRTTRHLYWGRARRSSRAYRRFDPGQTSAQREELLRICCGEHRAVLFRQDCCKAESGLGFIELANPRIVVHLDRHGDHRPQQNPDRGPYGRAIRLGRAPTTAQSC
ncbi:MAG: hypothetical protein FJY55_04120 [Betaproteobacteria bacterium]|nr:hypothetical protein [Betaproteobacteria bacterium]